MRVASKKEVENACWYIIFLDILFEIYVHVMKLGCRGVTEATVRM